MRMITDHKVNGLNEAIAVGAQDDAGPGGANHDYLLVVDKRAGEPNGARNAGDVISVRLQFQNGPIAEVGLNGISNEALLAVLIDRMRGFQYRRKTEPSGEDGQYVRATDDFDFNSRGAYACRENACALTHLEEALMWLQKRTRDRMARGVEGTHKV